MPAMTVHYRLTARDHEVIARGKEEIVRLGKAVGEPLDDRPFVMPLGASLHYQGTTRMGAADDGASVCSPDRARSGTCRDCSSPATASSPPRRRATRR